MITLLGALLGFLGSAFPELMKTYRGRHDYSHELAILDRQLEMMRLGHFSRLEEIGVRSEAEIEKALYRHAGPSGVAWVDGLAGTVRPLITYAFFFLYAAVKGAQWTLLGRFGAGHNWAEALMALWQSEDQALFATIISFWFGQRLMVKTRIRAG